MGLPDRETGGVPGLRGRGGAALACTLEPAGLGGGGSSATGWGSWMTGRLGGATLPLEEMVAFAFTAAGSVTSVAAGAATVAGASGSTGGAAWAARALAAGVARTLDSLLASAAGFSGATGWGLRAAATGFEVTGAWASGFTSSGSAGAGSTVSGSGAFTGSGGGGGLSRPSRSARRRTRSA